MDGEQISQNKTIERITKIVASEHSYFEGHFPGYPIMPGAAIVGLMLDTFRLNSVVITQPIKFLNIKFLNEILPDDTVHIIAKNEIKQWFVQVSVNDKICARAVLEIL